MSEEKLLNRVLIIDDDQDILTVAKFAFELNSKIEVKCLVSVDAIVQEAIEFKPDIIMLDMMMTGTDVMTTLQLLRSSKDAGKIPVILFSARADKNNSDQISQMGVQGFIKKPFDPMKLADQVKEIWESGKQ